MGMAPDAAPAAPGPARAEHIAMTAAALALAVLVVLPLAFLVWGSLSGDGMLTLEHFREALSNRLYVTALRNSLVLGAWTAVLSIAIGLPLAWAVSRTDVPARRFVHATALIAYLTPPYLTAIAFVNLFSPNAGLVNRAGARRAGVPALTFNVFSMSGLVLRDHAAHVPVRLPAGGQRAANPWTRPWKSRPRSSAPAAGARRRRSPGRWWRRPCSRAR